jgi:LytS/YehU family sensor histidine kinase
MSRTLVKQKLIEARAIQQQKESELNLLLSQLRPHFLFNTLNNLYGLSITQYEKLPGLLLRLSDLLRYSVYETSKSLVLLKDEMAYINNYIELEKLRIGDKLKLNVSLDTADTNVKIAPMLLIVFVENAFKHSKNTVDHSSYINLNMRVAADEIFFTIRNSFVEQKEEPTDIAGHSGLGLAHTIKRLEMLYPGEHVLTQSKENNFYTVELRLKVK